MGFEHATLGARASLGAGVSLSARRSRRLGALVAVLAICSATWAFGSNNVLGVGAASTQVAPVAEPSGSLSITQPGTWQELALPGGNHADFEAAMRLRSDVAPTGRGQSLTLIARRDSSGEYRIRVRATSRDVELSIVRFANGGRTLLGRSHPMTGLTIRSGIALGLRFRISGTLPTTLAVKVWPAAQSEPSRWSASVTDAQSGAPSSGWNGLRFALPSQTSSSSTTYLYDQLSVVGLTPATLDQPPSAPQPPAPPSPTPSPSPSPTASLPPTAPPSSNSFYVAPNGSDLAAGNQGSPWRTLQRAADGASAGMTVVVRSGTYAGFTLRKSGSASAPITFMAYPGEEPVVDGRQQVENTIRLTGLSNVRLLGLTVQGALAERQNGAGILVENSSVVELRNNMVRDNKSFGIRSQGSMRVLIDGNELMGNAVGVHVGAAGQGTIVSNNLIHDNNLMMVNTPDIRGDDAGAEGVALVKTTGTVIVRDNYIWGNRAPSYDYGWDGGAFSIYAASNWQITNNVTWDNRNVLETGTDANRTPCDGNSFTRNLNYGATTVDRTVGMVLRCASNTLIANNTFRGLQYFAFDISHNRGNWGGSIENLRIVNNVISMASGKIYGIESVLPASVVIDHNVLHNSGTGYLATVMGTGTNSLATFRSWTGAESHGLVADPRFVDPAGNDYRLRADSPALDGGTFIAGLTDAYSGVGPDCGYAERP